MNLIDPPPRRMALELALDAGLIEQARDQRIDLVKAAEDGMRRALVQAWRAENAKAIEAGNDWLATHGVPLPLKV